MDAKHLKLGSAVNITLHSSSTSSFKAAVLIQTDETIQVKSTTYRQTNVYRQGKE